MTDLPFRAEYAKSNRSSCRGCKEKIEKDHLRLAVMVQSPMFDGKQPMWYHFPCFFGRQRIKSVSDISHFDSIRWEDQEKIRKKIEMNSNGSEPSGSTDGEKSAKKRKRVKNPMDDDFSIECSKSSRATCRGCQEKIIQGEIRISKKDFESDEARQYGAINRWHHVDCFVKLRDELEYYDVGSNLPGFMTLPPDDQREIRKKLPKIQNKKEGSDVVDCPPKKVKDEIENEMEKQNKQLFTYRDQLKSMKKRDLSSLLEYNNQEIPEGPERMLDRLADAMTFGALLPCKECGTGQYVFRSGVGYFCLGHKNEWVRCENVSVDPERTEFKIPHSLKEKYPSLDFYKFKLQKRIFVKNVPSTSGAVSRTVVDGKPSPKVKRSVPLKNMTFVILCQPKKELRLEIMKLGGNVSPSVQINTAAVIAKKVSVDKMGKHMLDAERHGVQVVPVSFIEECKNGKDTTDLIVSMNMATWGSDPVVRIAQKTELELKKFEESTKHLLKTKKLKVKDGYVVDPDSGKDETAHVYRDGDNIYTTALSITDIQTGRNSYYKMQILESDSMKMYWLFRAWGRIGTKIGGKETKRMTLDEAISKFHELFEEKTSNMWENRNNYIKVPGKYCLMDISYVDDEKAVQSIQQPLVESKLQKEVQELISLIFNVDTMKDVMLEYEVDYEKMPLGKLSKQQLQKAYKVLTELEAYIEGENTDDQGLIALTNQFYTLIPHDFGIRNPPILNSIETVQKKREMLDDLLELEIAYNIVKGAGSVDINVHYLDSYYAQLKTEIEVLEKTTEEFEVLKKYVVNTHAETHRMYDLEISEAFKIKRHGEEKRYKPFKQLDNRKLLWHGSRLTNFIGILSQGLRIAPPEAPSAGYMFGKGIYFADMVSKSANYCNASLTKQTGLLLLCEVALGEMHERHSADYIKKLPPGKHSCKGVGLTIPDPADKLIREDGVEIPYGKGVPNTVKRSDLLYNEYIVYDVAQVHIQYLIKMNFAKPKNRR